MYKEKNMKKLLVILMVGAGLNAYAGPLSLSNETLGDMSVECYPSGTSCEDVRNFGGTCTCATDDTVMYFGHDGPIVFTATFANGQTTGSQYLGNNSWAILKDTNDTSSGSQHCEVQGTIQYVACNFSDQ